MTAAELAARLPAIAVVRRRSQSLAVLDAIMSAEWQYRYFSFDSDFGPGQALARCATAKASWSSGNSARRCRCGARTVCAGVL
jgi:hypothetical protein